MDERTCSERTLTEVKGPTRMCALLVLTALVAPGVAEAPTMEQR